MILLFDKYQILIDVINKKDIKELYTEQMIGDDRVLKEILYMTANFKKYKSIEKSVYVGLRDYKDRHKYHIFYITNPFVSGRDSKITAISLAFEELRGFNIKEYRQKDKRLNEVANLIIKNTSWSIGYCEDITSSTHGYYISVINAIRQVCIDYDVEAGFYVEVSKNKISNKYVEFRKRVGKNIGARVTYGHNALDIIKEENRSNIYTALIGLGRSVEVGKGNSRKINFKDIEADDKPLGQEYIELLDATKKWGIKTDKGLLPKIGITEVDTEDKKELLNETRKRLKNVARPLLQLKTTVAYLNAEIGDIVRVNRYDIGLHYETRIFRAKINHLNKNKTEVELGDIIYESSFSKEKRIQRKLAVINNNMEKIKSEVSIVMNSASGSNRIIHGNLPIENPRIGDTWYQPDPEHNGHTLVKSWDGEVWKTVVKSFGADDIVTTFETDEVLSKKLATAMATVINLDASRITSGTISSQRLDVEGIKESVSNEFVTTTNFNEFKVNNDSVISSINKTITDEVNNSKTELSTQITQTAEGLTVEIEKLEEEAADKDEIIKELKARLDSVREITASKEAVDELIEKFGVFGDENESYKAGVSEKIQAIIEEFTEKTEKNKKAISKAFRYTTKGLEISSKDSDVKLLLGNDKLSFYDGDKEVAYISNHRLVITSGVFVDNIIIGNHMWQKFNNVITLCNYVGGNSG